MFERKAETDTTWYHRWTP